MSAGFVPHAKLKEAALLAAASYRRRLCAIVVVGASVATLHMGRERAQCICATVPLK